MISTGTGTETETETETASSGEFLFRPPRSAVSSGRYSIERRFSVLARVFAVLTGPHAVHVTQVLALPFTRPRSVTDIENGAGDEVVQTRVALI